MRLKNAVLTEGTIWKQVILFCVPLLLSNILQQLYNAADLMIVGRFAGKLEMAAVGATGSITSMLVGLFLGMATGCSVIVAQYYGAHDYKNLQKTVHTAYAVAIVGGLILTVVGYFVSPLFLELMGTPKEILPLAVSYMRIFFAGSVPLLIYNMGAGIFRSVGDSRRPFFFLIIAAITNIILDLIFVIIFKWGVAGAGWATVLSQAVSAIFVTYGLCNSYTTYQVKIRNIKFHRKVLKEIIRIGVPAGLQGVLISISNVLIQTQINSFGSNAIAGTAASSRIDGFVFSVINAFDLSATTFAGQNIGAGLKERTRKGAKEISILAFVSTLTIGLIVFAFRNQLLGIFSNSSEVIKYGARMMTFLTPFYGIFALFNTLGGYIRGHGESLGPMLISMFGLCIFRIGYLFIALSIEHSIDLVFFCYPLSWTITLIIMVTYFIKGHWRTRAEQLM